MNQGKAINTIFHIVDSLETGGIETTVVRLALAQKNAGLQVNVITLYRNGTLTEHLVRSNIQVLCIKKKNGLDIQAVKTIRRLCKNNATIVHTHNIVPHYYTTLATLGLKVRRINTRHDMGSHNQNWRLTSLYRFSLFATHAIAFVSMAARDRFLTNNKLFRSKAHLVYNGIEPSEPETATEVERKKFRQLHKLPHSGLLIGSVGRLNPIKDYQSLISGFALLAEKYSDLSLAIAGDGPDRESLEKQIEKLNLSAKVILLGERSDISYLLRQFDIFALTSKTEGFSVALVEAAWAGKPLIATDVGGNGEIIDDSYNGYLISKRDPETISSTLEKLITNRILINQFGQRSHEKALKNWGLAEMQNKYSKLYELN